MSFADPQSVTISGVAKSMPRILANGQQTVYKTADGLYQLTISHTPSKGRVRSMARIDQRAIVPDPLTSANDYETLSFYFVVDRPEVGFTNAQVEALIAGLKTWLDSGAIARVYGTES
jgi:hypothetical protein